MANALEAIESKKHREERTIVERGLRENDGHLRATARALKITLGLLRRAIGRHPELQDLAVRLRDKKGHPEWGGAREVGNRKKRRARA